MVLVLLEVVVELVVVVNKEEEKEGDVDDRGVMTVHLDGVRVKGCCGDDADQFR